MMKYNNIETFNKDSSRQADALMVVVLSVYALVTVMIGWSNDRTSEAMVWASTLWIMGAAAYWLLKNRNGCRYVMAIVLMLMVGAQIHFGMGMLEYHFGVFVTLALLLLYRDWRPVVVSATTIAIHHVVSDRLQAMGWNVYCLSQPDFGRVMIHAAYVVAQTGFEIHIAQLLYRSESSSWKLSGRLQSAMRQLATTVDTVKQQAHQVYGASSEIASGSTDLSARTERTATRLQETSKAVDGVNRSIQLTTQAAQQARELVENTAREARTGGSAVGKLVGTMNDVQASSRQISTIIGVINGLSFQTNILALNAAVEAARAGEQGRGFAVVAAEVRSLAQRSSEAAKEIENLIQNSVNHVQRGAHMVGEAGQTMTQIMESVENLHTIIREISQNSEEQSGQISVTNQALHELGASTQENAALVEESTAAVQMLKNSAEFLNTTVSTLHLETV
ncbi:MAG: hypothetical protein RLZZ22_716 [Pseudomonadota bacterium]|jgi:methyl-accepting chemotaxis protein